MTPEQKLAHITRALKDAGRAEVGLYGGGEVTFLSIADLLKSKETERESDWLDISLLEEIQDARNQAAIGTAPGALQRLLANLRSRRGMDRAIALRVLDDDRDAIVTAVATCAHPATYAFLFPLAQQVHPLGLAVPVDAAPLASLASSVFGSPKHFALVEICRRAYKRHAMDVDRADKQTKLNHG